MKNPLFSCTKYVLINVFTIHKEVPKKQGQNPPLPLSIGRRGRVPKIYLETFHPRLQKSIFSCDVWLTCKELNSGGVTPLCGQVHCCPKIGYRINELFSSLFKTKENWKTLERRDGGRSLHGLIMTCLQTVTPYLSSEKVVNFKCSQAVLKTNSHWPKIKKPTSWMCNSSEGWYRRNEHLYKNHRPTLPPHFLTLYRRDIYLPFLSLNSFSFVGFPNFSISIYQCSGSMAFLRGSGSGSADPMVLTNGSWARIYRASFRENNSKRLVSKIENERFGLVFAKTGSKIRARIRIRIRILLFSSLTFKPPIKN